MSDPANVLAVDDIAVMTGYEVRPAVAAPADIEYVLERLADPDFGNGGGVDLAELEEGVEAPEPQRSQRRPPRSTTSASRPRSTSASAARTPPSSSSSTG